MATVSASFQVRRCPAQTIDNERPNVTIPLGRFVLRSRDVRWLFGSLFVEFASDPSKKPLLQDRNGVETPIPQRLPAGLDLPLVENPLNGAAWLVV